MRAALISVAAPAAQMASSTASSTCAAAKLVAVTAHRAVLVTVRTGMAITGTIANGHAASTSARPYLLGSKSSVDQTTPYPARPTKEVLLNLHPEPRVLNPPGVGDSTPPSHRYHPTREVTTRTHCSINHSRQPPPTRQVGPAVRHRIDRSPSAEMGVRHQPKQAFDLPEIHNYV